MYNILTSKLSIPPTCSKGEIRRSVCPDRDLDWESIYSNAFNAQLTPRHPCKFQYMILIKVLPLNDLQDRVPSLHFLPLFGENHACVTFFSAVLWYQFFWHSIEELLEGYKINKSEVILGIT